MTNTTGLVWFRNDLRTIDQHSLAQAMAEHTHVIGIYVFDTRQFANTPYGFPKTGKFRAQFLIESITQLREELKALNIPLMVEVGLPEEIMPGLIDQHNVSHVYYQEEWTSEEKKVTESLKAHPYQHPVGWKATYDQFLYHPEDIPFAIEKIPGVFTAFRKGCEKKTKVRPCLSTPQASNQQVTVKEGPIPALEDLGFDDFEQDPRTAFPFQGGERAAMERLNAYFWESQKLSYYKKTRNGLLGTDYSSKFSPWLALGCISPRTIYEEVKRYEKTVKKNDSTYWLIFELIWRDFFKFVSLQHGNALFYKNGIKDTPRYIEENPALCRQWMEGQTPEPFVNANMIELQRTGWMSNRGRQNVASYLTKTLKQDWRLGAAWFESLLLDYDVHSNYGNWNYVAGVGNDPRDRTFNVRLQADRYDSQGKFQKKWLQTQLFDAL